jgi:hypothetical protein
MNAMGGFRAYRQGPLSSALAPFRVRDQQRTLYVDSSRPECAGAVVALRHHALRRGATDERRASSLFRSMGNRRIPRLTNAS